MTLNLSKRFRALREVFTAPPSLSLSEWADNYRFLSPENCANAGRWKTSNMEPSREIMDTISDPNYQEVVLKTSAQFSKTEILVNTLLYFIHLDPSSILFIQPTVSAAEAFSKERVAPAIRDCKAIQHLVNNGKSKSQTVLTKQFVGTNLAFAGANSPAGLASRPIRLLLMDEISRYGQSAGGADGEGSAIFLAKQRTATFFNRKIVYTSTPGNKGTCHISALYETSDQRKHQLYCKHCEDYFEPKWADVRWGKDSNEEHAPDTALLHCSNCGTGLTDSERKYGIKRGRWVVTYPSRKIAGFHANALSSPWASLEGLVTEWLQCQISKDALRTFINTKLAEEFDDVGEEVDTTDFVSRLEDYTPQSIPEPVVMLTAGVDIQKDRVEIIVLGHAENEHTYQVEYKVIFGDTSTQKIFVEDVKPYLLSKFMREDGLPITITATAIDSGYNTQVIYEFCRKNTRHRFYAIKGRSGSGLPLFPKRATKTKLGTVFTLGIDTGKQEIMDRIQITDRNQSGYYHFNLDCDDDYFAQLTSESKFTRYKNGFPYVVWVVKSGVRNEVLDCTNYANAAKYSLQPNYQAIERRHQRALTKIKEAEDAEVVEETVVTQTTKRKSRTRNGSLMSGIV